MFFKGNIEKYAFAYLNDYIEQNGELTARISNISTVKVDAISFSSGGTVFYFRNFVETNEYWFSWSADVYSNMDNVSCAFQEDKYTSTGRQGVYTSAGNFSKSDYINGQSIRHLLDSGSPRFSDRSALYQYCTATVSEALSLIKTELGISAEHLGFYSYR